MLQLNHPDATVKARLFMLNQQEVGDIMYVSSSMGWESYFTIATLPTITPVNKLDEDQFGAPTLEKAVEDLVFLEYPNGSITLAHMIMTSIGVDTHKPGIITAEQLMKSVVQLFYQEEMHLEPK